MISIGERFKNSWNAFLGRDPTERQAWDIGYSYRPDRGRFRFVNIKSVIANIYNQIALDVSAINIMHVRLNDKGQYEETIFDDLNSCLTLSANVNQTGRQMIKDAVMTMFDEGCVALLPIDTDVNPRFTENYKIRSIQAASIVEWHSDYVRVRAFDNRKQQFKEFDAYKDYTVIIENPFYVVMNEPNTTLQRLKRAIQTMELVNDRNGAGKMDMIIQLPYSTRSVLKKKDAERRRESLEEQMTGSQYGIGFIDASEKVIQLNRSIENNLWTQVSELQVELYNQLGFSQKIFDGTASESENLNYYNRTVEPVLSVFTEEMTRKWLTKTAITQGQAIKFFRDPFKLVPVNTIAEIADKFTRNEIMTSNEMRSVIGIRPSKDPKADELRNSNLNHPDEKVNANNSQQFQNEEV